MGLRWIRDYVKKPLHSITKRGANGRRTNPRTKSSVRDGEVVARASHGDQILVTRERELSTVCRQLCEELHQVKREQTRLEGEVLMLSTEKRALEETIAMREAQILALRPYRTDFTRAAARKGFDDLMEDIDHWVETWTDKFIVDKKFSQHWIESLKHFPQVIDQLQRFLNSNPDLLAAIGYEDSDQNIISACIAADFLQRIEGGMTECTAPTLDPSAISSWRAQAYHALFSHPGYPKDRQAEIDAVSIELTEILQFCTNAPNNAEFVRSISSKIIEPSFNLYENFRRSNEEYCIETSDWVVPGARMGEKIPDGRLRGLLRNLNCLDAVGYNAELFVDEITATDEVLQNQLYFICSVRPALKVRGLQENYSGEPVTLVKEKVLVAWDPDLLHFGTPDMFERYKKHSVNELITKTFSTIVCPGCGEQMTQSRGTQYGITLCLNCNRQFCSRHKILWHYEHTCDEYETFLADPTFRSNAQIEAARREEYAFQDEQLSQRIKDADNHFAQSLMKEKEASQARRQAELERQARERRLAEERAAREAQQRREREEARKLSERKQREEELTKRITKPCPRCQVEIVKDGGW
ncbi:hypothetical protein NUW58_g201 [Xylaria curta]|uniref:Uncharacterized protein n=1 Tax=Xylaria curta TaxID=42375 RepID=A0ACC1PQ46_9PEZI|nr:hypothetical protein NUW58_g201 [Xylaria curta]